MHHHSAGRGVLDHLGGAALVRTKSNPQLAPSAVITRIPQRSKQPVFIVKPVGG